MMVHPRILEGFNLDFEAYRIERHGSGLINNTFRLFHRPGTAGSDYILQRINTHVFRDPYVIVRNHRLAADYLASVHPDYFFLAPVPARDGEDLFAWNDEYWRVLPYVDHTYTVNEADSPKQAYEAARQFGRLACNLSGISMAEFRPSIPNFHNLTLRYSDFQAAVARAASERLDQAGHLIDAFERYSRIAIRYEELKTDPDFPDRLMHHDTKINNVLLDESTTEGVCVIDLDTLMPGKLISDLGDMVRTYVSPVSEEETDFARIEIREPYYEALMKGYLGEMKGSLTETEKGVLFYAGQFMIYMQGIRFLTDYLNGDIYYPVKYPLHNLNRAQNQLVLLEQLNEKETVLQAVIDRYLT